MGKYLRKSFLSVMLLSCTLAALVAQDESPSGGATVKGQLVQNENGDLKVALEELGPTFNQQIALPAPPLPDDWATMQPDQRLQWVEAFEKSEEGQQFMARRKELLESANRFEIQLEPDGSFVIYDVPAGKYALLGRLEKEVAERNYVFEVLGVVDVGEKVDEILLDPIMVTATRLLKIGDDLPEFEIAALDGSGSVSHVQLAKRFALINFWSMKSPPSLEFSRSIQEAVKEMQPANDILLLSVCVDSDQQPALDHVKQNDLSGLHGFARNWEHPLVAEFGVRSIPALFLVGPDGKLKLTLADIQQASREGTGLKSILTGAMQKEAGSPDEGSRKDEEQR